MKARLILFLACLCLLIVAAAVRVPQWSGHAETSSDAAGLHGAADAKAQALVAPTARMAARVHAATGGLAETADSTVAGLLSGIGLQTPAPPRPVDPSSPAVTAVVRTGMGELKWVATQATDYTPLQAKGRELFLSSGCTYCHSLYARPGKEEARPWGYISTDARRWGPEPEPGEKAFDDPIVFGTQGIAPDLGRVGLKYGDEWHLAHFWQPPTVVPGSIMGGFSGLLFDSPAEPIPVVEDAAGDLTLERTPITEGVFDFASEERIQLTPSEAGILFVPGRAQGKYPVIWAPNDEFTGEQVNLVIETENVRALTAFVQKLGMNRGRWRDALEPIAVDGADEDMPRDDAMVARGKQVYERHCIGCHGVKGDGNGPVATFMHIQRPRNFTYGMYKFRRTASPLPSDADLLRTISRGVRGTAMPPWYELPLADRLAVIQYVKFELTADMADPSTPYYYFEEEPPGEKIPVGSPPSPTPELVAHGGEIWLQAKCWECHGKEGRGDGEKAAGLKDKWGFPIVPANLTRGQFKSGPNVTDVFRTISMGLIGTPMPSFKDSFSEEDRWALAYFILSLSAYTDPLTGEQLPLSPEVRKALDDPGLRTPGPEQAYGLPHGCAGANCKVAGLAGAGEQQ
jgi:cytochrome c oxidase cbb3-type subunit 2